MLLHAKHRAMSPPSARLCHATHHRVPCHSMPLHTMSHRVTPCPTVPPDPPPPAQGYSMPYPPCHTVPLRVTLCHSTPCPTLSHSATTSPPSALHIPPQNPRCHLTPSPCCHSLRHAVPPHAVPCQQCHRPRGGGHGCGARPGLLLPRSSLRLKPRHVPAPAPHRSRRSGQRPGSRPGMGEVSDSDSGIMLHSGPQSPVPPPRERVQAGRRQRQVLELRLEGCVQELRRLCLREAELTGTLPREYPLKAGEKPPKVRRRIGAAFKLDETLVLHRADPLSALERDLALQLQIAKAARRLCREENIGKRLRKRRLTAALLEEQKLKDLENILHQHRGLAARRPLSASNTLGAEEDTRPLGPVTPQGSPSPQKPPQEGVSGLPPSPWRETSLDGPYEKTKKPPSGDPGDGDNNRGSRGYPGSSSPDAPGSPAPAASPVGGGGGEVPPYRFVPVRTLVLCRQVGSSAPSTPEPPGRRGQSQSLRVESCWHPGEPRGRSAVPRRRPTYYTVTVPASCIPPPGPNCHSGSDDSISDLSSVSHATSPGSSSPDVSFPPPAPQQLPPPHAEPTYYPRAAHRFLALPGPPPFLYEQDLAPLRYQRLVASHSRIVRTPSLKDYAPAGGRGLSKATVTEELKSWHQRARLRGAPRPHSLDRQGAFRGPRGGNIRDIPIALGVLPRAQATSLQVLRRGPDAVPVPVQVYVPENGEIVTQV
ncbi:innate immunity activator protein isoform X2 [Heliangelus exortis]|uniref:innate immunity activator protein isoform X2 n=1 Tax=Heliangelus exortis TaxID=472823 RepID=UPI003A8F4ECF